MAIAWLLLGAVLAAPATQDASTNASSTLLKDLEAADAAMRSSHPGAVDRQNPGFGAQLADALALARSRAGKADSFAGYWWAMKGYAASFNDGHVSLNALADAPDLPTQWPGFLTGFDGDTQVVMTVDGGRGHPPLGARLLSCDGTDAQTLAARRIGDFNGRWNLQASRIHGGGEVLLEQGNPYVPALRTCVFQVDGREKSYALQWQPLQATQRKERLADTRRSFRPANGWHTMPDGGYWITTSSFNAEPTEQNFKELTALLEQLAPKAEALQQAPSVVLDVRGNSGGASHWSIELARLIWGRAAVDALPEHSRVEWRTSEANIAQLRSFLQKLEQAPDASPELRRMLESVTAGMTQARSRGEALWREPSEAGADTASTAGTTAPLRKGRVVVVADAACGSACLDALDLWKRLGAVQVGVETSADSLYMDVRPERLPSGLARISVPMKVFRGRVRGSNEPHVPDHRYTGDMRDTPALEAWLSTL
ncbi:S41 family peptidase [Stenotrophomonas sp. CC120223-11]|uniref:S41 family peptidase n=1 Tax=Stenotrophomonas sp. CC120223-11 TaxID=1378090 RepID=UPI000BC87AF5|nr:S41 family peptidase [Stenotrophomonas sp. CC120223-11]SNY56884.1 Peptidase family S41 [Stenotrophomonas sp. CC120223-11]